MLNMVSASGGDSFSDIGDLARQERHGASNSFRHRKLPSLAVVMYRPQKGGSASTRPCCSAMATITSASSSSAAISRRSSASKAFLSSARYPDSQPRLLSVGDCDHLAKRSPETAQHDPAEVANRGGLYLRMPRLFEDLGLAWLDGRFPRRVDKPARVQLLILDDWGTHTLTDQQRLDLLEIFEERYRRKSTLITAQLPVAQWHDMIENRPSQTQSSIGSSIMLTASPLKATACGGKKHHPT
ncbi:IstB-like ATP binding protein [Rhizobium subbaraonis]|uniref:IstB-like ATP binding protein n=1 Tax=Rhizobium subbaraonis TaxID=908946 RepID=A0A285V2H3_9HYPH|nr:IstB-like ATP binding protein [Rhizobium subbaraonis]